MIEARFKLFLLRGATRYQVSFEEVSWLEESKMWRVISVVLDTVTLDRYSGMGESCTIDMAKLRAAAEAYERSCMDFFIKSVGGLNKKIPYGLGVGFRGKSALRRAYAEYYERKFLREFIVLSAGQSRLFKKQTIVGDIWLSFIRKEDGFFGSGYGFNSDEAVGSSLRSALRKKDFGLEHVFFEEVEESPVFIRITATPSAWLECYIVGHFSSTSELPKF